MPSSYLKISTITGKSEPTFDERVEFVRSVFKYLRGNAMGRPPEGKWLKNRGYGIPGENPERRGEEAIYAEPKYNWSMGEVDAFHGGGKFFKFSDKFMKTGTGGHVFGWGHYVSEEKGVAKYYRDLYAREHGIRTGEVLDSLSDKKIKELRGIYSKDMDVFSDGKQFIDDVKEDIVSGGPAHENLVSEMLGKIGVKPNAAQYKVKLFKGKDPSEYTFLDWDKPLPKADIAKIKTQAQKEGVLEEIENMGGLNLQAEHSGEALYKTLTLALDEKEAASKFLHRAGISGIRYPVGTLSGGSQKVKTFVGDTEVPKHISERISKWKSMEPDMSKKELIEVYEQVRINGRSGADINNRVPWGKNFNEALDFLKNTKGELKEVTAKNYVIFDPKNIEIMEGPGKNALFKPGYPKGNLK